MTALIPCVGAIAVDDAGRVLLIQRANPPAQGRWSLPGGRVEAGESAQQAVVREVVEETGLVVEVVREVGTVEREAPDDATYVIRDFLVRVMSGELRAGDDAVDVRWVDRAELERLPLSPGLIDALTDWDLLPTT